MSRLAKELVAKVRDSVRTFARRIVCNLPVFPPTVLPFVEKPDPLCPISYTPKIDASRFTIPYAGV